MSGFVRMTRSKSKFTSDQLATIYKDVQKSMRSLEADIGKHSTKLNHAIELCETMCYRNAKEDAGLLEQLKDMKQKKPGYEFANTCKLLLPPDNPCTDYVREINYLGMYYSELGKQMNLIEEILKKHNPEGLKQNRRTFRSHGSKDSVGSKGSLKKKGTKKYQKSIWL